MTQRTVFLYGTLRREFGHELHQLVTRHSVSLGEGLVAARLFDVGRYPGMILAEDGSRVVGEVYRVAADEWNDVINRLDALEGCRRDDPMPHEYRRELVHVQLLSGAVVAAWAYIFNVATDHLTEIPGGDYVSWRSRPRDADQH